MVFASAFAFLLLLPWTAVVVWSLLGRHAFARVPAIFLWDASSVASGRRREIKLPAVGVRWLLVAALLGIFAATGPSMRVTLPAPAVVVIDCSVRMSAPNRVADALKQVSFSQVRIVPVPGDAFDSTDGVPLARLRFTNVSTQDLLLTTVRTTLRDEPMRQVYIVTDQPFDLADPRVTLLRPTRSVNNVAVEALSVSDGGMPQAMVTIRNDSALSTGVLEVDRVRQSIALPAKGASENYFVNLPSVADVVQAKLLVQDDIAADNQAWAVRQSEGCRVEALTSVSPAVARVIEVYTRHRPFTARSKRVSVVQDFFALPADQPAVAFSANGAGQLIEANAQPLRVEFGHSLTQDIDWPSLVTQGRAAGAPGESWRVLVSAGAQVLLAVREAPVRQVWVGYNSEDFESRADFVVLASRIFEWLGNDKPGDAVFGATFGATFGSTTASVSSVTETAVVVSDTNVIRSPGLYRDADELVAIALAPLLSATEMSETSAPRVSSPGTAELAGACIMLSLLCLAVALRYLTRF